MDDRYLNVKDLPWQHNVKDNTFVYDSIRNSGSSHEASVYRFTGEKESLLQGKGVLEMQMKLAHVFKNYWFEKIYKPYYMENVEYRNALTSGIYGPKTAEMVMHFQKIYMVREFEGKWDVEKGFGAFGENTREKLEIIYMRVRRLVSKQRREERYRSLMKGDDD